MYARVMEICFVSMLSIHVLARIVLIKGSKGGTRPQSLGRCAGLAAAVRCAAHYLPRPACQRRNPPLLRETAPGAATEDKQPQSMPSNFHGRLVLAMPVASSFARRCTIVDISVGKLRRLRAERDQLGPQERGCPSGALPARSTRAGNLQETFAAR